MDFIYDPGLVLHLPLWKKDGNAIMSADQYGHLCTVTGALWRPDGREFDGNDDVIDLPSGVSLSGFTAGTVELWLMLLAVPAVYEAAYADVRTPDAVRAHIAFYSWAQPRWSFVADTATIIITSPDALSVDTWYHIVGTFDASTDTTKLYVDAVQKGEDSTAFANVITTAHDYIKIGARSGGSALNCRIGEVRLYRRALSPLGVQHNYLATKWRYR